MVQFLDLNPYVVGQIYGKINTIVDQISMAMAIPEFKEEMVRQWKTDEHLTVFGPNVHYGLANIEQHNFFMQEMQGNFKILRVDEKSSGSFQRFSDYIEYLYKLGIKVLPNVEDCELDSHMVDDEDLKDLLKILPNLKAFYASVNMSGKYVCEFKQLELVCLTSTKYWLPLRSCYVQEICVQLKNLTILDITETCSNSCSPHVRINDIDLPMLEELYVNVSTIRDVVPQLLRLPCLKKLLVCCDDDAENVFREILLGKCKTITAISINNRIIELSPDWDSKIHLTFPKLKSIICENWMHQDFILAKHEVSKDNLENISCVNWSALQSHHVAHFVREYPQLAILNVDGCMIGKEILPLIESIKAEQTYNKPEPLFLWSYKIWRSMDKDELQRWNGNRYVHMNKRRCRKFSSPFQRQEDGFEFEFE